MERKKELEIYNYCEERWDYYEKRDGGYYPSKHDNTVLNEAANKFNITSKEAERAYSKISSEKANKMVKGLSKKQIVAKTEEIVRGNKETPWGMGLDKK